MAKRVLAAMLVISCMLLLVQVMPSLDPLPPISSDSQAQSSRYASSFLDSPDPVSSLTAESSSLPASSAVQSSSSKPVVSKPPTSKPVSSAKPPASSVTPTIQGPGQAAGEMRGVWISYLEISELSRTDYSAFKTQVDQMLNNIASWGMNAIMFQVRPFGDSMYPSGLFPWSKYISPNRTQGNGPSFDPFAYVVQAAHARNLQVHAWVNPFRASYSTDLSALADNNVVKQWLTDGDPNNDDWCVPCGEYYYYNPGIPEVRNYLVEGIREIVQKYAVDGIHFDDYFYPTTDPSFDAGAYARYGGGQSLADFRRSCVSSFVSGSYSVMKSIRSGAVLGVSPEANIQKNYDYKYADLARWIGTPGYVDYLAPQVYFGFQNSGSPFDAVASSFASVPRLNNVRMYIGIAVYKAGGVDTTEGLDLWAGAGQREWLDNDDILRRQILSCRNLPGLNGFVFFSYRSFFRTTFSNTQPEIQNLLSVLR